MRGEGDREAIMNESVAGKLSKGRLAVKRSVTHDWVYLNPELAE